MRVILVHAAFIVLLVVALKNEHVEWQEAAVYAIVWVAAIILAVRGVVSGWVFFATSCALDIVLLFRTGLSDYRRAP